MAKSVRQVRRWAEKYYHRSIEEMAPVLETADIEYAKDEYRMALGVLKKALRL